MYGLNFGGASTLFHLLVRHQKLVFVLGLVGLGNYISSNPGVGNRYGTDAALSRLETKIMKKHPELDADLVRLRAHFDAIYVPLTADQVRRVLEITDAATDVGSRDVLSDETERREAAWLLYLDVYRKNGETVADQLFPSKKTS